MNPQAIILALDAAITAAEHLSTIVADLRKQGLITVAEQDERKARIDALRDSLNGS